LISPAIDCLIGCSIEAASPSSRSQPVKCRNALACGSSLTGELCQQKTQVDHEWNHKNPIRSDDNEINLARLRPPVVLQGNESQIGERETLRPGRSHLLNELVLELDAAVADNSLEAADQAEPSQELTYVDINTFLANFSHILDARQQRTLRPGFGIALYFAYIEGQVALRQAPICLSATSNSRTSGVP
jgi:hypothetical protein